MCNKSRDHKIHGAIPHEDENHVVLFKGRFVRKTRMGAAWTKFDDENRQLNDTRWYADNQHKNRVHLEIKRTLGAGGNSFVNISTSKNKMSDKETNSLPDLCDEQ